MEKFTIKINRFLLHRRVGYCYRAINKTADDFGMEFGDVFAMVMDYYNKRYREEVLKDGKV